MVGKTQLVKHLPWNPEWRCGIPKAYLPASLRVSVLQESKSTTPGFWVSEHVFKTEGPRTHNVAEENCQAANPLTTTHLVLHVWGTEKWEEDNVSPFTCVSMHKQHVYMMRTGIGGGRGMYHCSSSKCLWSIIKMGHIDLRFHSDFFHFSWWFILW